MVVKSQIKLIKSLQQKKYRNEHGLFVVEGIKGVGELLDSRFKVHRIFTSDVSGLEGYGDRVELVGQNELAKMSGLKTPNTVLGVFEIPKAGTIDFTDWILAVDNVRDPGNLGTMIRLCDWFGVENLVCSSETVDCYNPKVLQATMGSMARVRVGYTDLEDFLDKTELPVFGAFMEGESVYKAELPERGILVMGNEARGISPGIERMVSEKITIPRPAHRLPTGEADTIGSGNTAAESLNVATATAILLSEIRRR